MKKKNRSRVHGIGWLFCEKNCFLDVPTWFNGKKKNKKCFVRRVVGFFGVNDFDRPVVVQTENRFRRRGASVNVPRDDESIVSTTCPDRVGLAQGIDQYIFRFKGRISVFQFVLVDCEQFFFSS